MRTTKRSIKDSLKLLTAITLISKNSFAMQVKRGGLEEEAALIGELGVRFGIPAISAMQLLLKPG